MYAATLYLDSQKTQASWASFLNLTVLQDIICNGHSPFHRLLQHSSSKSQHHEAIAVKLIQDGKTSRLFCTQNEPQKHGDCKDEGNQCMISLSWHWSHSQVINVCVLQPGEAVPWMVSSSSQKWLWMKSCSTQCTELRRKRISCTALRHTSTPAVTSLPPVRGNEPVAKLK